MGAALGRLGLRGRLGLLSLLAVGACGAPDPPADSHAEAPEYAAVNLAGDSVSLSDMRGDVVLLNVWATWCAPCRVEIPELQALHEEHEDRGLRVVGVTVDSRHAIDDVHQFIDEFGMTYDVWLDPDHTVLDRFRGSGVPLSVLIDRDGRIAWRHLGMFQRGDPALLAALERTLGDN
jgi:cytochrome c biogenesis protein CcmG, thiol:disulfide interchange protein DsbE